MAKVDVRVFATLRKHLANDNSDGRMEVDIGDGDTVTDLCVALGIPEEQVKVVFVNSHKASIHQALRDGDRVSMFPPIAGG